MPSTAGSSQPWPCGSLPRRARPRMRNCSTMTTRAPVTISTMRLQRPQGAAQPEQPRRLFDETAPRGFAPAFVERQADPVRQPGQRQRRRAAGLEQRVALVRLRRQVVFQPGQRRELALQEAAHAFVARIQLRQPAHPVVRRCLCAHAAQPRRGARMALQVEQQPQVAPRCGRRDGLVGVEAFLFDQPRLLATVAAFEDRLALGLRVGQRCGQRQRCCFRLRDGHE